MNLCELENMHTQIKCYTVGQLTTELTTPTFNQLKTEDLHGYQENHCNTSYRSCIFMDNDNSNNNNGSLTSLNTDNIFPHEINSSNNTYCNINQKFSHHGKHLQKHSNVNDQEVTPNYDYMNSDIPWTRYYTDNLTNSVESYDPSVHTNNDRSNLSNENYLTSSYHYDHHTGSSQTHSLSSYSIMNGLESSYFTNDNHQHCLNGTVQSSDLHFSDFHNNYHGDRKPDVMSFMNTSTIASDNNCVNDSAVNASINSLSNQYCVSQGIVLGNLKSFNSMDQFNSSLSCEWLGGQGSIEDNTNWRSSWKSSIEYDNQTNGQLYNQKSVTDEFKTFQCLMI
ncbi:unnamed protein product [Trichobilharzia szidati]|nr:unnamed protein product [Trichobilharzia szidati]